MNTPLTELYRAILESLSIIADDEGHLSMVINGSHIPWMLSEDSSKDKQTRRMVLPTSYILKNPDWNVMVAFHPLSENILMGMSPVIRKLLDIVNLNLNIRINSLMADLIEIATDPRKSKKISPKHADFMTAASEASESTPGAFKTIVKNISLAKGNKRVITLSVNRGSNLSGKDFSRVGIVKFPIEKEFEAKTTTNSAGKEVADYSIFGAKITKKDRNAIRDIFTWMFPQCGIFDAYSVGTNAMIAPYFDVILRSYAGIARRLNEIVAMMGKLLPDDSKHLVNLSWLTELEDLRKFNGMLPTPMEYNDGTPVKGDHRQHRPIAAIEPQTTPSVSDGDDGEGVPLAIGMSVQTPMVAPQAYVTPVMQPLFEAVVETPGQTNQVPVQPVYQQPVYQQPAYQQPQPMYQAPAASVPSPVVTPSGGMDPASEVVNAFANLNMRNMPQQPQGYYQQQPMMPMGQQPMMMNQGMPMQPQMVMLPNGQVVPMQPGMQTPMMMPQVQPMYMNQQPYMGQPPGMSMGGYGGGRQYLPPELAMAAPGTRPAHYGR